MVGVDLHLTALPVAPKLSLMTTTKSRSWTIEGRVNGVWVRMVDNVWSTEDGALNSIEVLAGILGCHTDNLRAARVA